MHEQILARAALPQRAVVAGLLLRPYSLGNELWLIRDRNPLIELSDMLRYRPEQKDAIADLRKLITEPDLVAAALICCQTWSESRGMATDWLLGLKLAILRHRLHGWVFRRPFKLQNEIDRFLEYRGEGVAEFRLSGVETPGEKKSRCPGAPWLLRVQQWLVQHYGLTESEAWDYPIGLAVLRWQTYWEEQGGIEIYNYADAEFDHFVDEQERNAAAEVDQTAAQAHEPREEACQV
jgi:hypothetical protein